MITKITPRILIVDDDQLFHLAAKQTLKRKGIDCKSAYNTDEAQAILKNNPIDIVFLDVEMRTPDEGLRAIPVFREMDPDLQIVMSSGHTEFSIVREAMQLGAIDYVPKDFEPEELVHVVARVFDRKSLIKRTQQQNFEAVANQTQHLLIGESPAIAELRKVIDKVKKSTANVVISGETGSGKEVVARHLRKSLEDGCLEPFVAVDSSTIQSTMAESILFGHEKGAFTGADASRAGIFEEANGGVVYFDEVSNMPMSIQAKLLRVIQEKEVMRLGSSKPIQLDFRVICATNRDLEEMVRAGEFKEDLFQRLNVIPIQIPPLRERKSDIPLLVNHAIKKFPDPNRSLRFTAEALEVLAHYNWPGNIRELVNLVAFLLAMTEGTEIDVSDLPPKFRDRVTQAAISQGVKTLESNSESVGFYDQVEAFEKNLLSLEYGRCEGNISKLALKLGMDRSHLYTKLKQYGLHGNRSINN